MLFYIFSFSIIVIILRSSRNYILFRKFPQTHSNFIFGDLFKIFPLNPFSADFRKQVNENIIKLIYQYFFSKKKYDDLFLVWFGWIPGVICVTHKSIEEISSKSLIEKPYLMKVIQLKEGLVTSKPEKWKGRRKMIEPFFTTKSLQSYVSVINEVFMESIKQINCDTEKPMEMSKMIQLSTLNIIMDLATKLPANSKTKEKSLVLKFVHFVAQNCFTFLLNPACWVDSTLYYTSIGKKLKKLKTFPESLLSSLIQSRFYEITDNLQAKNQQNHENRKDLLDLFFPHMRTGLINHEGVYEELLSMIVAGHETISTGLVWTLFCLGNHEKIQQNLYEEIILYFSDVQLINDFDKINQLTYLDQCLKEGLRLFPPIGCIFRKLSEDCTVCNYKIPKGTHIAIPALIIQRDPTVYRNPHLYDPDRFAPENVSSIPKHAFIPFGFRPRNCIGYRLAYLEMKIFLIHLLKKYHISSQQTMNEVSFNFDIALQPSSSIEFKLTPRHIVPKSEHQ